MTYHHKLQRILTASLLTLLVSCGKDEASPVIECKFEGYVFSVDKNDAIFIRCERNDGDPYDIVAISPEKTYRFSIITKNKKFYLKYPRLPMASVHPFNLDQYVVYCGPSKNIPYNCGAMITDAKVPFYLDWYEFEGTNYDARIAIINSAKRYIDKHTRRLVTAADKGLI